MRNELYSEVIERHYKKFVDMKVPLGDVMFNHIFRNLCSSLATSHGFPREYHQKHFMIRLRAIKDYLKLLEEFPDFKRDEVTLPEGHFQDLEKHLYHCSTEGETKQLEEERRQIFGIENSSGCAHYVFLAKQRLESTLK